MPEHGLHLFLGSDRSKKFERIQALERSLRVQPLDRHHIDATMVTPAALLALCRQQPAASPVRLIVVDQAHRLEPACAQALLQHAEAIAQSACVLLLVETELSARHPLAQAQLPVERFAGRDVPAVKPFALVDALGSRDSAGALAAIHDQLLSGREPTELLALIAWQVQRWLLVRRLLDAGSGPQQIAQISGLKPWQVERLQSEVAQRSVTSLQELLQQCWRTDADAKSGRTIPELALEQLVIAACVAPAIVRG